MNEARLRVVFGMGQAGSALAAQLAGLGVAVRAVSRSGRCPGTGRSLWGTGWRTTDAADPEVAANAAKSA
jgi:predicted dinucleotide-binding enzyme